MLELKKVTKIYETGDIKQKALENVSISFRKSEFASILGPSGSGKTTLLNIIGGLDKYTSGDLIINNISTKKYKDADWDSYRNHRIGFVFQSYNLISHQTVLQNVVLALTLSGIPKKEGISQAKKVLTEVGLKDHMNKKPNQLSGGQMQRVAIARALVNDPDILLADEPTGALDSETSVQIMNLLKKIANNKLVIMVTHNPDLAEQYSNRIITLKDGKITSDTNPFTNKDETEDVIQNSKTKKTTMSFLTALSLSFNNLMTKKGRTILVSFAGSIGIIGIALILSLSTGFQNYIDKLQEDTLSSYPLTITSETADMTSLLLSMVGSTSDENVKDGIVKEQQFVTSMFASLSTNDLSSFNKYLEENQKLLSKRISTIKYNYSVDPLIYTKNSKNELEKINPNSMFSSMYGNSGIANMYSSYASIFSQMLDDPESLNEQYDVLSGRWPSNYDEMIIVLPDRNSISDLLIYFLGLRDIQELYDIITKSMSGESVDINNEPLELTYEDLMNIDLRLINQTDTYKYNEKYKIYEDMTNDEEYMENLYDKALKIKIVGVVTAKEGTTSMALTPGVVYTSSLIDYITTNAYKTEIVKKQLENEEVDVFSNTKFDEKETKNEMEFEDLISVDNKKLESAFNIKIDENQIKSMTTGYMDDISKSITANITPAKNDFDTTLLTLSKNIFKDCISSPKNTIKNPMLNVDMPVMYMNDVDNIVKEFLEKEENTKMIANLESKYVIPANVFKNTYSTLISGLLKGYITMYNKQDSSVTTDESNQGAIIVDAMIDTTVNEFVKQAVVVTASQTLAQNMTEAVMQKTILTKVGELSGKLMGSLANAFDVDPDKIASAFKFDLSEEELRRIMTAMVNRDDGSNAKSNLISLGYQSKEDPTSMSFYFNSFDSKEYFIDFIDKYNKKMEDTNQDDKSIKYTDTTGLLMSSVKKIVNSVSYVLIAFVSISLVVSSIMIGIITYISVLERTKEIGILRAIGASKRNISSIFNAETFIIGLLSGFFGIGITLVIIPIINSIIHSLTDNVNISATISITASMILISLSVVLTLIGGLIPSKKASKQDPVIALRTE